jgi:hypothetical protein
MRKTLAGASIGSLPLHALIGHAAQSPPQRAAQVNAVPECPPFCSRCSPHSGQRPLLEPRKSYPHRMHRPSVAHCWLHAIRRTRRQTRNTMAGSVQRRASQAKTNHRTCQACTGSHFGGNFRKANGKPLYTTPENGSASTITKAIDSVTVRPSIAITIAQRMEPVTTRTLPQPLSVTPFRRIMFYRQPEHERGPKSAAPTRSWPLP